MRIDRDKAIDMILYAHKGFLSTWEEHLYLYEEDNPGITIDFSAYVTYVKEIIKHEKFNELKISAELIERFINDGDENVQYGVTIGFLEDIINCLSHGDEKYTLSFTQHLLPKSLEFCKELDDSWGTKTIGLQ